MPTALSLPTAPAAIDASLLPDIIELYLEDRLAVGAINARTQHNYRNNLAIWAAFWDQAVQIHRHSLSPEILQAAHEWMCSTYRNTHGRPAHPNSIAHCWIRLKQVFNWAYERSSTGNVNLSSWCPHVEVIDSDTYFPTENDIAALLRQPSGDTRMRDVAAIAFLVSTGARRFEAANALAENVQFVTPASNLLVGADHRGTVWLRHVKGDAAGQGQGRVVAFCSPAGLLLKAYMRGVNKTAGPLFDLSDNGISQMIERHALSAGVPDVSPHAFRRLMSDYWDETHGYAGRAALKRQLGHVTTGDVTEKHYISRNRQRVGRELLKWHVSPLSNLAIDWREFPVHVP